MAVRIRLKRIGTKNTPVFRIVVADSRSPRDGKFIELIGTYDPKQPDHNSTLKLDRIEHWIANGAQPSDTVRSLIKKNKKRTANAGSETKSAAVSKEEPVAAEPPQAVAEEIPASEAPTESAPSGE